MSLKNFFALKERSQPVVPSELPQYDDTHVHTWQEYTMSYAPARREGPFPQLTMDVMEKTLLGVTTLVSKCVCGEYKTQQILGSPNPQLDELLDKAESIGVQYMQRGNSMFVIQKYTPPQQAGGLPLR